MEKSIFMSEASFLTSFVELHKLYSGRISFESRLAGQDRLITQLEADNANMQKEVAALQQTVSKKGLAERKLEQELQVVDAKIEKANKLYLKLTNNKELKAKQKEIDKLTKQKVDFEEKILTLLEEIDTTNATIAEVEENQKAKYKIIKKEWLSIKDKKAAINVEISQIEAQIETVEKKMSDKPKELKMYKAKLIKFKEGALNEIKNGACGGCHQALVPQVVQSTHKGNKFVECPNCNRFLF